MQPDKLSPVRRRCAVPLSIALLATSSIPLTYALPVLLSTPQAIALTQDARETSAKRFLEQGNEQYLKGQLQVAIEYWQQALFIYQQLQNRQTETLVLKYLGAAYIATENYSKAVESLQSLLPIAQAIGDYESEAQALGNLGIAYKELGKYNQAIESHQKAWTLMQKLKNRQGEGQVLGNLGNAYEALGNYNKAIASYNQSLTIAQQIKDRIGEGIALGNLGLIYANKGEYDKATEFYQQSLAIKRAIGDKQGEATTLNNLGIARQAQGSLQQAIEYYNQGLSVAHAASDHQREAEVLGNLGLAYGDQGNFAKAIEYQQQSLNIAQAIGNRPLKGLALNNLGYALWKSNNLPEAEKKLRDAINVLESLRPGLADIDNISIFDTQFHSYKLLQEILIAQNKSEAALAGAERGRARAFVELLAKRLSGQLALDTANSQPPSIKQIQQIARTQKATLVEYSIVPEEGFKFQGKLRSPAAELYIWVVQPTGEVAFRRVDLKFLRQQNSSLDDLITRSRRSIGVFRGSTAVARVNEGKPTNRLQQLYQLLIKPITELLPTNPNSRVIFIPQESLFLVPFGALQDASGQYLIEKHTILTASAIQVLNLTRQQRQRIEAQHPEPLQGKDVLVVGNPTMPTLKVGEKLEQLPPLPSAQREAVAIAKLLNTKALIGDQATKVDIVQQMAAARLVHLATHGLLDDIRQLGVPGAIALAPSKNDDGFLTAGEIFNLKLNAELVVLSACQTGRGEITGDGVVGLSRSLIAAGVPSVIVSLWSVPDTPTALLMTEFYRNFQQHPDKAQALRSAMLTTMKQYPNPIDWAAFTLIGEAE